MRKLSIYIMSLLAVGFTACTEDFNGGIANPQGWEQEAAKNITFATTSVGTINLGTVVDDSVSVCSFTEPVVEESKSMYKMKLDEKVVLPISAKGKMATTDLQQAIETLYGKRPVEHTMSAVVTAYVQVGDEVFSVPAAAIELKATPKAPVIENEYYVTGDILGGWGPATIAKFNHSGKDVYEDPIFTLLIECPKDKANFKIISASGIGGSDEQFWGAALGTAQDGDDALTGTIVKKGAGAINVAKAGWVKITLDMMAYTYKMEPIEVSPFMWVPGNHNGWGDAHLKPASLYSANMDMVYTGHLFLDGEFKFTPKNNWDADYGSSGSANGLVAKGSNINAAAGFYFVEANIAKMTYQVTETAWGLIGNATVGGWDNSTPMVYDRATNCWSVTTTLTEGEFKFRANNDWAINVGGAIIKLVSGGDNIAVTASMAGNYTIKLYLTNDNASYCTMTKN